METRQYSRRNKLSRSVERPAMADNQADSEEPSGDATPRAAAAPRGQRTPVVPRAAPTGGADESNHADAMTDAGDAQQADAAVRHPQRMLDFNAPPADAQHRPGDNNAMNVDIHPPTPRPPAASGADDDMDVARIADVVRKVLSENNESKRTEPSYKEVETEVLTDELIKRMRYNAPMTDEQRRIRQRLRGYDAFNALCEAAQDLPPTVPTAAPSAASGAAVVSAQSHVDGVSSQTAFSSAPAASRESASAQPDHVTGMPSYCSGRLPRLIFPADNDEGRRDDCNDSARMPVPTFDGKNWAAFKSVFESVARHYKWSDPIKALRLKCCIKGEARAALGVVESIDWSYDQLVEHMELRHGRHKSKIEVLNDLDKLYRKPGQSLTQWRDEVISVANTGKLTAAQWKQYTHYSFLKGLHTYGQMQSWVGEHDKEETLASCYDWAKRFEREVGAPTYSARPAVRVATHDAPNPPLTAEVVHSVDAATSAPVAVIADPSLCQAHRRH